MASSVQKSLVRQVYVSNQLVANLTQAVPNDAPISTRYELSFALGAQVSHDHHISIYNPLDVAITVGTGIRETFVIGGAQTCDVAGTLVVAAGGTGSFKTQHINGDDGRVYFTLNAQVGPAAGASVEIRVRAH